MRVTGVLARPGHAQAEVRPGWEIVAVDDVKLKPTLERIAKGLEDVRFLQAMTDGDASAGDGSAGKRDSLLAVTVPATSENSR